MKLSGKKDAKSIKKKTTNKNFTLLINLCHSNNKESLMKDGLSKYGIQVCIICYHLTASSQFNLMDQLKNIL